MVGGMSRLAPYFALLLLVACSDSRVQSTQDDDDAGDDDVIDDDDAVIAALNVVSTFRARMHNRDCIVCRRQKNCRTGSAGQLVSDDKDMNIKPNTQQIFLVYQSATSRSGNDENINQDILLYTWINP